VREVEIIASAASVAGSAADLSVCANRSLDH